MPDIEAVGDIATGALIGRAIEPGASGADGHTHEGHCLNCGAKLEGEYCHECGQKAHVHRTLGAFFHDLAHGVLHFEGKIWRTLPLLAWKPGELTRSYIEGKRASFVSPLALFLFSVFLMFAIVSATGNLNPNLNTNSDLAASEKSTLQQIAKLQAKRAEQIKRNQTTVSIDADIREQQSNLEVIRDMRKRGITEAVFSRSSTIQTDIPLIEEAYHKAKQNPDLLLYKLKSNSYKWSWALIPLSVPFLWLLFPFSRRFRLYDHVVFITYSLSFMTLLVVVGTLTAYVGIKQIAPVLLFVPPIHMYRQLRGAYGLGRLSALWRTVLLVTFAIIAMIIFILAMVGMGIFD